MYSPNEFRLDDKSTLCALAAANPFATVITSGDGTVAVSHLPLLVDAKQGVLRGHLARANEQFAHLEKGVTVLALFHGPHAYVSPSVYGTHPSVPTWNYVVVHATGRPRLTDESGLRGILEATVARFDDSSWRLDEDPAFLGPRLAAIAGFEVDLTAICGKWKLSQNRPESDIPRIVEWLEEHDEVGQDRRGVAALMRAWYASLGLR